VSIDAINSSAMWKLLIRLKFKWLVLVGTKLKDQLEKSKMEELISSSSLRAITSEWIYLIQCMINSTVFWKYSNFDGRDCFVFTTRSLVEKDQKNGLDNTISTLPRWARLHDFRKFPRISLDFATESNSSIPPINSRFEIPGGFIIRAEENFQSN